MNAIPSDANVTFGHDSRNLRLHTLARLRWLAIAGQTATVAAVRLST